MAVLKNPHPKDNPLARKVDFDTIVNFIRLDPKESFNVCGPTFSVVPTADANGLGIVLNVNTQGTIKAINLNPNRHFYVFYMPQWDEGSTMWIVPGVADANFQNGIRDFTESSQLDQQFNSSEVGTWRESCRDWIASSIGYNGTTNGSALIKKEINFTSFGADTNKVDISKPYTLTLQVNV